MDAARITVGIVDDYDEEVFQRLVQRNLESAGVIVPVWEFYGEGDASFSRAGKIVRIAAFDGDRLIGLSWGEAFSKSRFVMQMSLVEEDYRGHGIYSRMLALMLEQTAEFDEVESCHQIFNNRIIATKLKRGFHIVGLEQSILIGPRIRLRYYHNPSLLELMKFRVGLQSDPRPA